MARTALRSVSDAIEATRSFLLPLSFRRLGALSVIVLFMGTPGTPIPATPQFADPRYWQFSAPADPVDGGSGEIAGGSIELLDPGSWPAWLLATLAVGLLLVAVYALAGVLMRFVLVEALGRDGVRIRRDARTHLGGALQVLGLRLVLWGLALPVVALAGIAVVEGGPVTVGDAGAVGIGAVATASLGLAWSIELLTLQFVLPTMIASETGVVAGWQRFWPTLRAEPVEYALYWIVRILVGIGVGFAASVGVLVALGLAGVVLGTIAAIVVVLAGGVGSLGAVAVGALGVLVAIFLLVGVAAAAAIAIPFQCYLWIYALLVLGDVDPELDLVSRLRTEARDGGPSSS